jgi:hypothetical protein
MIAAAEIAPQAKLSDQRIGSPRARRRFSREAKGTGMAIARIPSHETNHTLVRERADRRTRSLQ